MIAILSPIDKLVKNENINHTALLTDYPRKPSELSAPKPIFVKDLLGLLGFLGTFVDQQTGNFNSVRHQTKLNSTNSVWKFTQTQTGPVNLPIAKAQVGGFCSLTATLLLGSPKSNQPWLYHPQRPNIMPSPSLSKKQFTFDNGSNTTATST